MSINGNTDTIFSLRNNLLCPHPQFYGSDFMQIITRGFVKEEYLVIFWDDFLNFSTSTYVVESIQHAGKRGASNGHHMFLGEIENTIPESSSKT